MRIASYLLLGLFLYACGPAEQVADVQKPSGYYQPWEDLGVLFHDIQMAAIFEDSKTFVDYTPKKQPAQIVEDYEKAKDSEDFDLKAFVEANFDPPFTPESKPVDTSKPISEHLNSHWDYLTRTTVDQPDYTTLIPLPNQYVVPGGRFREVYYWDSYFTMVGLGVSGRLDLFEAMLDNFAFLIDTVGFIPNGNRTYYLGRSQPPYFSSMVNTFIQYGEAGDGLKYLSQVEKEYSFWMDGAEGLTPENTTYRRAVLYQGFLLNRFWDNFDTPRPESYREDIELAHELAAGEKPKLYRHLRAAAESGWDFSSRWFAGEEFATIRTTDILPVDLNCLLYQSEQLLSVLYAESGDAAKAQHFQKKADLRKKMINQFFWNAEANAYQDVLWAENTWTGRVTAAGMMPLFFGIADEEKARLQAETMVNELLAPGGLLTTPVASGQQWDEPNGWAPLQWIAVKGLEKYALNDLAADVKSRWLSVNQKVYTNTGKMMEKYNVVDTTLLAGGGEYPTQDGFGWTNGVVLGLLEDEAKY